MGSQSEYWTEVYAKTHEERLAQSLQFAREELAAKYGAAETRAKYMKDLVAMYDKALTDAQKALVDYETARGRKARDPKAEADAAVAYLRVMTDAGSTIATEYGKARQRELEAEAGVEARYRPTAGQASAIGSVVTDLAGKNLNAVTTPADLSRMVSQSINSRIPSGTFSPGTDASKVGAADLFTSIDAQLQSNPIYQANRVQIQDQMSADIAAKMGVDPKFTQRREVQADKDVATIDAKAAVGKTGAGTSSDAAKIAKDRLAALGQPISDKGAEAIGKIPWAGQYFDLIAEGMTIAQAKEKIKESLKETPLIVVETTDASGKKSTTPAPDQAAAFEKQFTETRSALTASNDGDQAKLFDPTYVDVYSRSIKSGRQLTAAQEEFAAAVDALSGVPTEEAARRRGAEIYEPISPGVRRRASEGAARLEERAQESRITGAPMSDEDLLSSRLLQGAPQISDARRIMTGASAAAIRALNEGWTPDKIKGVSGIDFSKAMTLEEFDALPAGPAAKLGYRLYSNVKERQLRDVSPEAILKYASDLAGGNVGLRDAVLQEYYKHSVYEMRGTKAMKAKADVEKVENPLYPPGPKPTPDRMPSPPMVPEIASPKDIRDMFTTPPEAPKEETPEERQRRIDEELMRF